MTVIHPDRQGWEYALHNPHQRTWGYYDRRGVFHRVASATRPPGADQNVYPLRMPPDTAPGAPVTIGAGQDRIQLRLSGNPDSISDGQNSVSVLMDDHLVATELMVSDFSGQGAGQTITIQGTWGPTPHVVTLTSALIGPGLRNMWITAVVYNGVALVYNGPSTDYRGAMPPPNATSIWDNTGAAVDFSDTVVPTTPIPVLTTISGAMISGTEISPGTLAELVARTPPGGILTLPSGTIVGVAEVGAITIEASVQGGTTIDASGLSLAQGKAILVPTSRDGTMTARGLVLRGARSPDRNGAAIRQSGEGISMVVDGCEITDCDDGILTFAGQVDIIGCHIHDNGRGDGRSHEIYAGGPSTTTPGRLTVRGSQITCGPQATHAVKSRMAVTVIEDCELTQCPSLDPAAPVAGRIVDTPNGGDVTIARTRLIMTSGGPVHEVITYGADDAASGSGGLRLEDVALVTDEHSTVYVSSKLPAPLAIVGSCTYERGGAPSLVGWSDVSGALSAR